MSQLIASSKVQGCHTVTLRQHDNGKMGNSYTVRYGKQKKFFVNAVLAQEEYQACVFHQFDCVGYSE